MVRDIIDTAITQHKPLEIAYSRDGNDTKLFNLNSITYSQKYGRNYICGYCEKYKSELTFCIDKIIYADVGWIEILGKDVYTKRDGLYLITCRGDMHLEFELRKYKKGIRLQDHYQNEYGIESWYSSIDVLAYHYIPFYTKENKREWIPIDELSEEKRNGYFTFAYLILNKKPYWEDAEYNYDNSKRIISLPNTYAELTNAQENRINYTVCILGEPFDSIEFADNLNVLAYNYCSDYREKEHSNDWKLADEFGIL